MTNILVVNDREVVLFLAKITELSTKIDQLTTLGNSQHIILARLAEQSAQIDKLSKQGDKQHMALADDLNAFADRTDAALTGIAGDIRDLKNTVTGPLTAAEAEVLKSKLEVLATRAEGIDAQTAPAPKA